MSVRTGLRPYHVTREVREVYRVPATTAAEAERIVLESEPETLERAHTANDGEITFIEAEPVDGATKDGPAR